MKTKKYFTFSLDINMMNEIKHIMTIIPVHEKDSMSKLVEKQLSLWLEQKKSEIKK